jgi:hypothetical protein
MSMSKEENKEVLNQVITKIGVIEDLLFLYDTEKPIFDGNEDPEEVRYFMKNYRVCFEAALEAAEAARKQLEALYREGSVA